MTRYLPCTLVLSMMIGCASDPAPTEQLRLTEQALTQARSVGASQTTPEFVLAEQSLAAAVAAMKDEDYRLARLLAEKAELDARLAEAKVLNDKSKQELVEVSRRIERLREQLRASQ